MTITHLGEQWFDVWLEENALICWTKHEEPWEIESRLLGIHSFPLNIQDNRHHPYCAEPSKAQQVVRKFAHTTPIAHEDNQQRRGYIDVV